MECPICQEKIGVAKVTLECGHVHCVNCFSKWCRKSSKCPLCRAEFTDEEAPKNEKISMCPEILDSLIRCHSSERTAAAQHGYSTVAPLAKWWSRDNENKAKAELDKLFENHARVIAESITTWYES
ncbi:MAG: hypothetical protein CMB96_04705 [Flavobacteriaceae bacterium]|nr:hypothetical protein [Flavobacteriaceae bacterium]|tara:strand:+ start:3238 stop:3615 length:378 start_codon:yes stop_codon:yes gene_type:complete